MKRKVLMHQRNKALQRVNETYPSVFEGKPNLQTANETLAENNTRITELIATTARPRPLIIALKNDLAKKLSVALSRKAGIGMLLATQQNDLVKLNMYKAYKRIASRPTTWKLYHTSLQVADELAKEPEQAADSGISEDELAAFRSQVDEYKLVIDSTDIELKQRKSAQEELDLLIAANISIIRMQLEPYANLVQDLYPAFFREFKIARRSPLPRKTVDKPTEILAEVSGTVSDNVTGDPVANATVLITELDLVANTDADGYFLFDEVPAGTFTLSCHAPDYKLPANVTVTITDTMPQDVNFGLEPEAGTQAA